MSSALEEVISLFVHTSEEVEEDAREGISPFSVRSPVSRLAHIDAMATAAGVSRNEMANELLRLGITSVMASLPPQISAEIAEDVSARTDGQFNAF